MKKYTLIVLILLLSFSAFAQHGKEKEKLKALKVAHITEQLELTPKEAEVFWPIYNTHEDNKDTLRKNSLDKRKKSDPENLSNNEAKQLLLDMLNIEKQKQDIQSKYVYDLLKVIPATKVLKLFRAERTFKQKMIKAFKNRREQ